MPVEPHEVERQHDFGREHLFPWRLLHDLGGNCEERGAPFLPERLIQGVLRHLVYVTGGSTLSPTPGSAAPVSLGGTPLCPLTTPAASQPSQSPAAQRKAPVSAS